MFSYTPNHQTDKILQSRSALEGERKQVTVLFGAPIAHEDHANGRVMRPCSCAILCAAMPNTGQDGLAGRLVRNYLSLR